ncbi:APC family permease [Brevibacterium linens]|uniref:APC family permease n=1 Tax=Brevibacterium linens TaxID=1703 RepID=UPI003BF5F9C6
MPHTRTTVPGLRTPSVVFFVLAAAAPLTILAGFVPLGLAAGGDSVVLGFLYPGLIYLLFAVGYTTIAAHVREGGAFLTYITAGLGPKVGAAAGSIAYLGYLGGQIGFTASASVFASLTIEGLAGVRVHWLIIALVIILLVLTLALREVGVGARVVAILLIAEMTVLMIFFVAVLFQGGHEGLTLSPFSADRWLSPALPGVFILTFIAFVGFEQTTVYRNETSNPNRTIPRATYAGVGLLILLYSFGSWVIVQAAGESRLETLLAHDPSQLVFDLNDEYVGPAMTGIMLILVVTSFIAGVIAIHNTSARYLVFLSRAGLVTPRLKEMTPAGSPFTANIVQAALVMLALSIFALTDADPYTQVVAWTNTPTIVAVLLLQILTSMAVIRFFRRRKTEVSFWKRTFAPAASAVLISLALGLLIAKMGALTGLSFLGNLAILAPLVAAGVFGFFRARRIDRTGNSLTDSEDTKEREEL